MVPRNASSKLAANVVSEAFSMKSRNGGLYCPSSTSGMSHHSVPMRTNGGHHHIIRRRRGPRSAMRSHSAPSGITAKVAAALTPPTQATARPLSAAIAVGDRLVVPMTRATKTHGATAVGQTSIDDGPMTLSIRGDNANAKPPAIRAHGVPMPSSCTNLTNPRKATTKISAHQSRCTSHGSIPAAWPIQKNGPIGKR